jgi:hypothetical protein
LKNYIFPKGDSEGNIHGVITASGHLWREQRRFALHKFRDFGLGKNMMQERVKNKLFPRIKGTIPASWI